MATNTYQRAAGAVSAEVDGETVVLSPTDMRYHGLNDTAAAIWEDLEEPRTVDGLVATLGERYEVDPATCRRDVEACLTTLVEYGALEVIES